MIEKVLPIILAKYLSAYLEQHGVKIHILGNDAK